MFQPNPFSLEKILVLLVIDIIFIIFLAIISCFHPIVLFYAMSSITFPKKMNEALDQNGTCELVVFRPRKKTIGR